MRREENITGGSGVTVTKTDNASTGQEDVVIATTVTGGITQLTGDVTAGPGSGSQAATLANSGATAATYGDATHVSQVAIDAKGRVTSASNVAITFPAATTGPSDADVVALTTITSGMMVLSTLSINAPSSGIILLSFQFTVQLLSTPANSGYAFQYGYSTGSTSAFDGNDTGTLYQDPTDTNQQSYVYHKRIGVSAGVTSLRVLFKVVTGTLPPSGGTAKVSALPMAWFLSS